MNKDRFLNVLRWQLTLSKRQLLIFGLVIFAIISIPQAFGLLISRHADTASVTSINAMVAISAYLVMGGVSVFTHLKTRQQRINEFMLPASNKEKFLARYLVMVVAMSFAAMVGFLAGDLVQWLLTLAFGSAAPTSATGCLIESIKGMTFAFSGDASTYVVPMTLSLVSLHALFLLLGSLFNKHALVLSVFSFFGLNTVIMMLIGLVTKVMFSLGEAGYVITIYDDWCAVVASLVNVAFIIVCFRLAYRRYTRLQVINNKWINK